MSRLPLPLRLGEPRSSTTWCGRLTVTSSSRATTKIRTTSTPCPWQSSTSIFRSSHPIEAVLTAPFTTTRSILSGAATAAAAAATTTTTLLNYDLSSSRRKRESPTAAVIVVATAFATCMTFFGFANSHVNNNSHKTFCEAVTLQNDAEKNCNQNKGGDHTFRLEDVYDIVRVLGEGGYGTVFMATRKSDGRSVALKTMPREFTSTTDFQREVRALRHLTECGPHPHIVQMMDLHQDDDQYYLSMELISGGELLERLIEDGPYTEAQAATFVRQLAEALFFCHNTAGWLHGDLKLENLLLSSQDYHSARLKLVDFGCAMPVPKNDDDDEDENEDFAGTPFYWPPELFYDHAKYTSAADMWAAGIIVYVLVTGSHPFDKDCTATDEQIRDRILSVTRDSTMWDKHVWDKRVDRLSPSCRELLHGLLHPDPKQRMTSTSFLRHPWVQGLTASWENVLEQSHQNLQALGRKRLRDHILKKFATSLGLTTATAARTTKDLTSSTDSNTSNDDDGDDGITYKSLPKDILSDENLIQIFRALDLKQNGVLEFEEIQQMLRTLGVSNEDDVKEIFRCADMDQSGVVKLDEFMSMMRNQTLETFWQNRFRNEIVNRFAVKLGIRNNQHEKKSLSDTDLHRIFHALDLKQNGVVDREELQKAFQGIGVSKQDIDSMFSCSDLDSSQVISFDEFKALMKNKGDTDDSNGPSLHDKYRHDKFRSNVLKKFSGPGGRVKNQSDTSHPVILSDETLRGMFDAMDMDHNGSLDAHEIRVVLRGMGETDDFISQIVAAVDKNRDGKVSWEEFVEIMRATEEDDHHNTAQAA